MSRLRIQSARVPYRRAGIEFGNLPLVLGPEHFERGIAALQQLAKLLSDPILTVKVSDDDTPDVFRSLADDEREAIVEAARAAAEHADPEAAEAAAEAIFVAIVGAREEPTDPTAQERAERLAQAMADEAQAEADRLAAEVAAQAEADRVAAEQAAADKAEADRLASEAAAKAEADRIAADEAVASEETSKGTPAPAPVKTAVDAKPEGPSGRKPKAAAANTKAA